MDDWTIFLSPMSYTIIFSPTIALNYIIVMMALVFNLMVNSKVSVSSILNPLDFFCIISPIFPSVGTILLISYMV